MDKQDIIISLLKEINENIDNVNMGVNKLKVSSFKVTNYCINEDGRWEGETLIGVLIDTNILNDLSKTFKNCSLLKNIDVSTWNTENITNTDSLFYGCTLLNSGEKLDLKNLFAKHKCTQFVSMFEFCNFTTIDISNWDMSNISNLAGLFATCKNLKEMDFSIFTFPDIVNSYAIFRDCVGLEKVNLIGTPLNNNTGKNSQMFEGNTYPKLYTLVGDKTIDEVVSNNLGVYIGATTNQIAPPAILERNSLRAIINGVADLSGKEPQTLIFGDSYIAKLTEEDIAIATAKNWTIA